MKYFTEEAVTNPEKQPQAVGPCTVVVAADREGVHAVLAAGKQTALRFPDAVFVVV